MFVKFSPPTHHDKEPYGTECYVMVSEDLQIRYLQTSPDENNPTWEPQDMHQDVWATRVKTD